MYIDAASSDDLTFAGNHLGSRSNNYVDVRLHIRIARLANRGNTSVHDRDICLHDSPVIENQSVGDDGINRALAAGTLRLAHTVANDFPASELHLLAVGRVVLLHFNNDVGIR